MEGETQPRLVRAIGRWSLVALVLNSIIGGGIFGLPSIIAGLVGVASPLAYVAAGAGIGVVTACFAEVASRFSGAGGPYLYAREAFGRFVGIEIAWLTWLARLSSAAGLANLFVVYLAEFWPRAEAFVPRITVVSALLGILCVANYRGVSAGKHLSNIFTIAKLVPLGVFAAAGLFFTRWSRFASLSSVARGGWLEAVLLLVFAFGGIEYALIPMSEAKDPRRDTPFAAFVALAVTAVLFTSIQFVVVGVLPDPGRADRPLAAAARVFSGASGATFMTAAALVSLFGVLSAVTLAVPRLAFALAEKDELPRIFGAIHSRFRTPHVSIVIYGLLAWALAVGGSFRWNVTLSAVARLFTYASTCGALAVLRRKFPGGATFLLPAGPVFAFLGVTFSAALISRMGLAELKVVVATIAVAFLNWLWVKRRERKG